MSNQLQNVLDEIKVEKDSKLLPENIKKGVQIFDITGTLEQGGASTDAPIKLFETEAEMLSDATAKENDLAVIYKHEVQNASVDSKFSSATFPNTVTLPEAITDYVDVMYRAVDDASMFECYGSLDANNFMMDCYTETDEIRIQYESSDGITYTRTDGGEEIIDFGTEIYYVYTEYWNDAIGYFIQVGGSHFGGLYQYGEMSGGYLVSNKNNKILVPTNRIQSPTDPNYSSICSLGTTIVKVTEKDEFGRMLSGIKYGPLGGCYLVDNTLYGIQYDVRTYYWTMPIKVDWKNKTIIGTEDHTTVYLSNDTYGALDIVSTDEYIIGGTQYADVDKSSVIQSNTSLLAYNTYNIAPTQFTLKDANQLLPGKTAYGKDGEITGDGSVYNNLDPLQLNEKYFHYPKLNSEVYGLNNTAMFGSIPWEQRGEFKYVKRATNADCDLNLVETNDIKTNEYIYNSDKSVYFSGKDIYSTETKTKLVTLDAVTYIIPDYTGTIVYFVKNISSDKKVYKVDLNNYETIQTIGNFTATGEYSYNIEYDIYKPRQMYGMTVENFIVCQITSCTSSSSSSGSIRKSIYVFDAKTETVKKIDSDTRSLTRQGQSYDTVNSIATNDIVFVEYGSYYGNMFNKFIKYTSGDSTASVITTTEGSSTKSLQNSMNILVDNYIYTFANSGHNPTTCDKVNIDSFSKTALTVTVNGQEQSTPWYVYTLYLYGMGVVGSDAHGYHLIDDIEFSDTTINVVCRDLTIPFTKYLNSPTKQMLLSPNANNIYTIDVTEDYVRMELMGQYRCIFTQKFYKYSDASDFDYIISKISTSEGNSPFIVGANPELLMNVAPISQTEYDAAISTVDEILGEEV